MSAQETTPIPVPPLRLVLGAGGAIVTAGRTDLAPGAGERVVELAEDRADALRAALGALAAGDEIAYDEATGTFAARPRPLSAAEQADRAARTLVVNAAKSAEGLNLTALTQAQRNALLAVLLWRIGAVDGQGVVLPLSQWAQR